jgi:uncharacterized RDD family membrane protein YckC
MCARCVAWGERLVCCPSCPYELRPPAPITRRIAAHLVDALTFVAPFPLALTLSLWLARDDQLAPRPMMKVRLGEVNGWLLFSALMAPFIVQLVFQLARGRSVGKWLLGLRVVEERGRPANPFILILGRNVGPLVLYGLCGVFPLIDLVMFFLPPHQRWRDKVLGLRVIEDPRASFTL